jgi:hypothetical protein
MNELNVAGPGTFKIGSFPMKGRWYCIVVGGVAFWFPAIVFVAIFHENTSVLWLNVIPFLGLIALALLDWISLKRVLRWNWVLAGVYILGPISMLAPLVFFGGQPPSSSRPRDLLIEILVCLFPPFTIWLSLLNGMIFSVLAATIALPIFAIFERGRGIRSLL